MDTRVLDRAKMFAASLPENDREKISATISALGEVRFEMLYIKTLREPIREVRVGWYRIVFFQKEATVYITDIFRKTSKKTPKEYITHAQWWFKNLT